VECSRKGGSQGMKAKAAGKKAIDGVNCAVNYIVLIIIVAMIAFAGYALWDSHQIHQAASKSNYTVYKPTVENQGISFKELQGLNEEVFAWLTVYETNIDYPVTQGQDNMKYIDTSAEGKYSLSGAIFLDSNNSNDFSDFNSILYGHHMAKQVMFGEIGEFTDKSMFDTHRYGNLYYNGKDHGIEFFAFLHADAYDSAVFAPGVKQEQAEAYMSGLLAKAVHTRDIGVTTQNRIILLSTCSSSSTNGRDILVGRITSGVYDKPGINKTTSDKTVQTNTSDPYCVVKAIPEGIILLILMVTIRMIIYNLVTYHRWKKHNNELRTEVGT
jgi:sortase B